MQKDEFQALKV